MTPLLSILIPAYNAESWVASTIRPALAQAWMNKEIIFIDDGSSDRTLSIAHQFASKTVSVVSQENQGAAAAETKRSPIARESTFNGWMLTISYHQTKDRAIK